MIVFAVGDLHFPWSKGLDKIYKQIKNENPDVVVQMGDLYDQYVFSRFDKDLNIITPKEEVEKATKMANEFWAKVRKIVPKARLIQLKGNHDMRRAKKILSKCPELADEVKTIEEKYYSFPGVEVMASDRDFVELDNVVYCHGWLTGYKKHLEFFGKSVVHGHTHTPELYIERFSKSGYELLFEADCGSLIDRDRGPFNYTSSKVTKWKPAFIVVYDGIPKLELL